MHRSCAGCPTTGRTGRKPRINFVPPCRAVPSLTSLPHEMVKKVCKMYVRLAFEENGLRGLQKALGDVACAKKVTASGKI